MAAVNNRGTNSFWMSVWGPFGKIDAVQAVGVTMHYPLHKPTLEIRSIRLEKEDPGSEILEKLPVVDEFGYGIRQAKAEAGILLDDLGQPKSLSPACIRSLGLLITDWEQGQWPTSMREPGAEG